MTRAHVNYPRRCGNIDCWNCKTISFSWNLNQAICSALFVFVFLKKATTLTDFTLRCHCSQKALSQDRRLCREAWFALTVSRLARINAGVFCRRCCLERSLSSRCQHVTCSAWLPDVFDNDVCTEAAEFEPSLEQLFLRSETEILKRLLQLCDCWIS